MSTALLLTLFTLYPYNLGGSAYLTVGQYSSGADYLSQTVVGSVDRRSKDYLAVSFENHSIRTDSTYYHQQNLMSQGLWWIRPEVRIGAIGGVYQSNGITEGWLAGLMIEGEWKKFRYTLTADRVNAQIERMEWDSIAPFQWRQVKVAQEKRITHVGTIVGYPPLPYLSVSGGLNVGFGGKENSSLLYSAGFSLRPSAWTAFNFNSRFGEGRQEINYRMLTLDNNPNRFNNSFSVQFSQRIIPNLTVSAGFTRSSYTADYTTPFGMAGEVNYSVKYYSVGLIVRI